MATILPNPAWPLIDVQVDPTTGPPNTPSTARMSLQRKGLGIRQVATQRGRQYEQGHCESGTAAVTVLDPQEVLNPLNSGSPLNTGSNKILPYRSMWIPVLYPVGPGSGNIINTGVNVAYDPSFELNPSSALGLWNPAGGTTTLAQSAVQHFAGTKSLLVTQSAAGVGFGAVNQFRTVPGVTYTMSGYVYPTGGATVQMRVLDASGVTYTSASATTQNAWTRLSVTWNAVDTLEAITFYGTVTTTPTWYLDATQLEFGASASTFATTGPTLYSIYTGYVERWPQTWTNQGFRGVRPLECVDALSPLSRAAIAQSYDAVVASDGPLLYVPFSNTASMTTATIGTGMTGATPSELPNSSNGGFQWGGDTNPDGTPALVVSQRNAATPPAAGGVTGNLTLFELTNRPISLPTKAATVEMWIRNSSGVNSFMALAESVDTAGNPGGSYLDLETNAGFLQFNVHDPGTSTSNFVNVSNANAAVSGYPDGLWHYYAITFAVNGTLLALTVDNVEADFSTTLGVKNIGYNYLYLKAYTGAGDPQAQYSAARMAAYTRDIGSGNRQNHYQRGVGYLNEVSGARVTRLLTQYWGGTKTVATGSALMAPDFGYNARSVLDVLTEIADTENGLVYADRNGVLVFEDRSTRYATQASVATFGDGVGELPYENLEFDFDPTYVYSQANLTRPGNSSFPAQVNAASQTAYGQRILSQQLQVNTDFDLTQAAIFYLQRYGNPLPRIRKLTLNPGGQGNMWPTVLALEISQRVTVKRRVNGVVMSGSYFIEQINHAIDIESSTWTVDLQLSPVFVPQAWVLGDATYGVLGTTTVPVY